LVAAKGSPVIEQHHNVEVVEEGGENDFAANVTKSFYTHPLFADQIKSFIMQTELHQEAA